MLEDPWDEPPAEAFAWTTDPIKAPNEPQYVEIEFAQLDFLRSLSCEAYQGYLGGRPVEAGRFAALLK